MILREKNKKNCFKMQFEFNHIEKFTGVAQLVE